MESGVYTIFCFLILGMMLKGSGFAQSPVSNPKKTQADQDFELFQSLRVAGNLAAAETMCRERLQQALAEPSQGIRSKPSEKSPAESQVYLWTVRLSAVLVDQALSQGTDDAWKKAAVPCDEFLSRQPNHPRVPWVRLQRALVDLAAAREAVSRSALHAPGWDREGNREQILHLIRKGIGELESLAEDVARMNFPKNSEITGDDVQSLLVEIKLRIAEALLWRGKCYPKKSPDQVAAAAAADEAAGTVLRNWPGATNRGQEALRYRILARLAVQDVPQALELARALMASDNPKNRAACLLALTAGNQLDEAEAWFKSTEASDGDWELALLQWMLAKKVSPEELEKHLRKIEQQLGPYWRRLADLQILEQDSAQTVDIPSVLAARGRQKLVLGDYQGAAGLYLEAAKEHELRGEMDSAMEAVVLASAAFTKGDDAVGATETLRSMALRHPQHPRSSQFHLQGIWLAGKTSGTAAVEFLDLFKEHFRHWPDQPTTLQGIDWLEQFISQTDQWSAGAEALLEVGSAAKIGPIALRKSLDFFIRDLRETWLRDPSEAIKDAENARTRILNFGGNGIAHQAAYWIENLFLNEVTAPDEPLQFGSEVERHFHQLATAYRQNKSLPTSVSWNELLQGLDDEQRPWGSDLVRRFVEDGRRQGGRSWSPAAVSSMLELLRIAPDFGDRDWLMAHLNSWIGDWSSAVKIGIRLPPKETVASRARLAEHWESLSTPPANESALQLWNHTATRAQLGSATWREARLKTVQLLLRLGRRHEAEQIVSMALGTLTSEQAAPFRKLLE